MAVSRIYSDNGMVYAILHFQNGSTQTKPTASGARWFNTENAIIRAQDQEDHFTATPLNEYLQYAFGKQN